MVALARVGRRLHLAQQGVHLGQAEDAPGADAAVTRHGRADLGQAFLERQGVADLGELVGEVAHQALDVGFAEQRRDLAHHHGARPEGLHHQTELGELLEARREAGRRLLVEVDDLGDQQALAGHAVLGQGLLHALVDQALMGGVLVDDDHAVVGLGDDIGGVELAARRAQGIARGLLVGGGRLGAGRGGDQVGGERRGIGRRRLGEAGSRMGPERRRTGAAAAMRAERRRRAVVRAEGGQGGLAQGGRGAVAGLGEGMLERADDQPAHQAGVAEAHLGLGRVHVDVDGVGRKLEEQRHHGVAVARQEIGIGPAQGAVDQLVAHRAAIDEQVLRLGVAPIEGRQPGVAGEAHALALGVDRQGVVGEAVAHHRGEALEPGVEQAALDGGEAQHAPLVGAQAEGGRRVDHGEAADRVGGVADLGARRLEELEPHRRGVEQLAHLDPGAGGQGGGLDRALGAALDGDRPGLIRPFGAAGDGQAADPADRRQRLAAEPQGGDVHQIVVVGQLRGGVALDRQGEGLGVHAVAVVGDADQAATAVVEHHVDAPGAGVDGVLDQLLDRRGGALDDLAGGDAVDRGGGQDADGGHGVSPLGVSPLGVSPRGVSSPAR